MSFTKPSGTPGGSGFNSLTPLPSVWLNYVSNNFPSIVDGIGGGKYELTGADLRFVTNSRRVKFNMADPSFPVELRGYVTIGTTDESGYATGVGSLTVSVPATFTAGITYSGAITYSSTVTFNGAVTFGSGGDITLNSGCTLTAQSGSSIVVDGGATFTVNGTTTLNGSVTIDSAVSPTFDNAKTYDRTLDNMPLYDTAHWDAALDTDSMIPVFTSQSISGGQSEVVWSFRPPSGATVTAVAVYLTPASGHASVPTVTLSAAKLLRTAISAPASASVNDPAASVVAYETPHELTLSGLSLTFNEGDLFIIRLAPEQGAGAATGLRTSQPKVTFTRSVLAEE